VWNALTLRALEYHVLEERLTTWPCSSNNDRMKSRRGRAQEREVLREELERFVGLLNDSQTTVVVEGESDRRALIESGATVRVITLSEFERGIEGMYGQTVSLLMDLDRQGDEHVRRLVTRYGNIVRFSTAARDYLRTTTSYRRGMRSVYELLRFYARCVL
jgi:5S rRNA maturation endonuclease (ribonuclease M5)